MSINNLDIRKKKILFYIIEEYLHSYEPVGSRTISKNSNLGISAATIRNEMSDLEEMRLLIKSHASSGRVPSEMGYKFYVEEILNDFRNEIINSNDTSLKIKRSDFNLDIEHLVNSASEVLSSLNNNIVISSIEKHENIDDYHVEVIKITDNNYVLLRVLKNGEVNSTVFSLNKNVRDDDLKKINYFLNAVVKNHTNNDEFFKEFNSIFKNFSNQVEILKEIVNILRLEYLKNENIRTNIFGLSNIFNLPEYNNLDRVKEFFGFIEKKDNLTNILKRNINEHVTVYVGSEIGFPALENNSLILTNIYLNNYYIGKLGLIGPLRMDYKNAISTLYNISWRIANLVN